MNKTRWIIFTIITVGILALLVIFSGSSRVDVSSVDPNNIQQGNSQNGNIADHVFGKVDSKVTLIEYGDFQCPGCAAAFPRLKSITEEYREQIRFVFRNFPLGPSHPNGRVTSAAAEAAGLQGKFWEMYEKIYSRQNEWTNLSGDELAKTLDKYAKDLGLDVSKFRKDITSNEVSAKINYDRALGNKIGVNSTPTFFLNGVKLEQTVWGDDDAFKQAINKELEKNNIQLPPNNK